MIKNFYAPLILALIIAGCGGQQSSSEESQDSIKVNKTADSAPKGLQSEEVSYEADGITMKGYIAWNADVEGKRPGVIVVHEWWGHNEYARKRADMLAELGYTALAVDMYGDGKTADHPDDAGGFASAVMSNIDGAKARFMKALETLKGHPSVDPEKTAAIGYCFGGGIVLHMARFGADLDGVVSFHGSLGTQHPAETGKVTAKVLVCHGAADNFISPEQIEGFKKEMDDAGVDYEFIDYEGAKHAFTNPGADKLGEKFGIGLAYNEQADKESWEKMKIFSQDLFQ